MLLYVVSESGKWNLEVGSAKILNTPFFCLRGTAPSLSAASLYTAASSFWVHASRVVEVRFAGYASEYDIIPLLDRGSGRQTC